MDQINDPAELRIRAAKYRAMARLTTDQETAKRIHGLADELQTRVAEIENERASAAATGPNPVA